MVIRGEAFKSESGLALRYDSSAVPEDGVWEARALVDFRVFEAVALVGRWKLGNGLPSVEVRLKDRPQAAEGLAVGLSLMKRIRGLPPASVALTEDVWAGPEAVAETRTTVR